MRFAFSPLMGAACAALILLSSGCETAPVRKVRGTQTVVLSPDSPSAPIEAEVVTDLKVVLPGPDTGSDLIWEIVSNNTKVLDQTTKLLREPPVAPADKPTTTVTFYILKPGKSVLRFVLVHPNQAEAIPVAKCFLAVHVNDD
jgi:hypothetical protein